ncbi:hypothetical protein M3B46_05390 [Sphingobacterium daejeonense]|uniref:DUF6786 family protein n=1 Tax=Sphingobacterium daejeonense TaxID=371142 RepID=UPI0021A7387B|nr:DUF6786 family protein [Sphingobacterium daejeonense]MCT1530418.1 hypothetical protein [Sphingobacterium daejeonense]
MKKQLAFALIGLSSGILLTACQQNKKGETSKQDTVNTTYKEGQFGYDLEFLQKYDSVLILSNESGLGQILVSPKYQGKVFTSTADGPDGKSFGWVNYKAFSAPVDPHMNAYGGEDRLWLGPEGGPFSLYFENGKEMVYENWKTPTSIDTESWKLISADGSSAKMEKDTELKNYAGTVLTIKLNRDIKMLSNSQIESDLGIQLSDKIKSVGFSTLNSITNTGKEAWTKETGAPCLWSLDMFMPTDSTVILVPYEETAQGKIATTDYFGEIDKDRIAYKDGVLYFKADGKSRGKLGLSPQRAKTIAGSYDLDNGILTVTKFTIDSGKTYLNQEWTTKKDPFIGDAVNAYNDGPLEDGGQMGPFYEIESVSPAAFLKPSEKLDHSHNVYHFMGDKEQVSILLTKLFNISVQDIQSAF